MIVESSKVQCNDQSPSFGHNINSNSMSLRLTKDNLPKYTFSKLNDGTAF